MAYYKIVDVVQKIWKETFGVDKSKTQVKKDLEQGSVSLNGVKLKPDDIFEFED